MKKFFSVFIMGIILLAQLSCGKSEYKSKYADENEAAIGVIKETQPELRNDLMRIVAKSDKHDGGGWHMGYYMIVYNESTKLCLPIVVFVMPTSKDEEASKDLRYYKYKNPRYDVDVDADSKWVPQDQIEMTRNIFNGDIEYHYR